MRILPFGKVPLGTTIRVDRGGVPLVGEKMTQINGRTFLAVDGGTETHHFSLLQQIVGHVPPSITTEIVHKVAISDDTPVELLQAA